MAFNLTGANWTHVCPKTRIAKVTGVKKIGLIADL